MAKIVYTGHAGAVYALAQDADEQSGVGDVDHRGPRQGPVQGHILKRHMGMFTIKPLDEEAVEAWAKKCGAVLAAENHNKFGGLWSWAHLAVPMQLMRSASR